MSNCPALILFKNIIRDRLKTNKSTQTKTNHGTVV